MSEWIDVANVMALAFVLNRTAAWAQAWAKRRWGLTDPPRWLWATAAALLVVYGALRSRSQGVDAVKYMLLGFSILAWTAIPPKEN